MVQLEVEDPLAVVVQLEVIIDELHPPPPPHHQPPPPPHDEGIALQIFQLRVYHALHEIVHAGYAEIDQWTGALWAHANV